MLRGLKDKALEKGLQMGLNNYFSNYGKIKKLNLDTTQKRIYVEVLLNGEDEVTTIEINEYEIFNVDDNYFLKIKDIDVSKEWMKLIARDYLANKELKLSPQLGKILSILI